MLPSGEMADEWRSSSLRYIIGRVVSPNCVTWMRAVAWPAVTVTSVLLSAPVRFSSGVRTSAVPCRSACSQLPDERASQLSGEVITSIVKGVSSVWRKVQAASLSRT